MLYLCFCLLISDPAELLIWFYVLSRIMWKQMEAPLSKSDNLKCFKLITCYNKLLDWLLVLYTSDYIVDLQQLHNGFFFF